MVNEGEGGSKTQEKLPDLDDETKKLVHRLNRIQGQIEAIKKTLIRGEPRDCLKTMQLIKAADHAMKKFGEAYLSSHFDECMRQGKSPEDISGELKSVISSALSM